VSGCPGGFVVNVLGKAGGLSMSGLNWFGKVSTFGGYEMMGCVFGKILARLLVSRSWTGLLLVTFFVASFRNFAVKGEVL
ncbi:unnamed protein product, partial [Prorocentrum cordatum]